MYLERTFSLKGHKALVTGASSGLGLHIAGCLAKAGAAVVLAARRSDLIETAANEIRGAGGRAYSVQLDVTDTKSIPVAFDKAESLLDGKFDILVNNAGILYMKKFLDQDADEIARVFDTNLKGAMLVAQEAARRAAFFFHMQTTSDCTRQVMKLRKITR